MAIQIQGNSGVVAEVGGTVFRGMHVHIKPMEYGALGHYRLSIRIGSTTAQAANARIFELRNTGSNLIIPTRMTVRVLQTAAGTAQENSLDCYRLTNFTAVDTTNTTTPVPSPRRTSMAAAPGNVQIRATTAVAAGMTGGTLTKDTSPFATIPFNVAAAASTTYMWGPYECFDDTNGTHPFVLAQNEGFDIENRVLNATSYGVTWYIDLSYAEVGAF